MEGTFYDAPNDYRNYLAHHGVKGMHWGIRHDPQRSNYRKFKRAIKDGSIRSLSWNSGNARKRFKSYVEEAIKKQPSYAKMKELVDRRNELWNQQYDLMLDIWNDDKECEKIFGKSQMDPKVSDSVAYWREYSKSGKGHDGKERKHATMEDWVQDEISTYLKGERYAWNKDIHRYSLQKRDMSNANKSYVKKYKSIQNELDSIGDESEKIREQVITEMLGSYADTNVNYIGFNELNKFGNSSLTARQLARQYISLV